MGGFDAKKYRDTVLKPTSKGEGYEQLREVLAELRQDPDSAAYSRLNLNALYDVPSPVSTAELKEWKDQIVPALNKAAQALPSARLLKALLEILDQQGHALTDPAFWGRLQAKRQKHILSKLEAGVRQLSAEYPLGVVPRAELFSRLETVGITGVTEESILSVARKEGLEAFAELHLPISGIPERLKGVWRDAARHPDYRSVLDLLLLHRHEDIKGVRFLDKFVVGETPFTVADLDGARRQSELGQDTDALQDAQKFLGTAKDVLVSPADIQHLVITTVIDWVDGQLGRGKPKLEVREELVRRGFHADDASRLVSTLAADRTNAPRIGLEAVREKLSEGLLAEAERILAAMAPPEGEEKEHGTLTVQITELTARKQALLQAHHQAVEARDFSAALTALNEAMRIDQADDSLVSLRELLPPAAPASLALRVEGESVILRWPQSPGESLTYTVVRQEGRAPATHHEGTLLAGDVRAGTFCDAAAPAAKNLGYSVFATHNGQVFSGARTATVVVLPSPTDLRATSDPASVLLSWSRPSQAAGFVVTQLGPNGVSTETELPNQSTFRVAGLMTGASYHFSVRAIYLLTGGRKFSDPVATDVVPRGEASAVKDLVVTSDQSHADSPVRATWSRVDGFDVELWRFPPQTELPPSRISRKQASTSGGHRLTPLPGSGTSGSETCILFRALAGINMLVPLTVDDDEFLIGNSALSGSAPQPSQVVAEAFGDDLRLSWEWPQGDYIMEVAWEIEGRTRTRRVTRARYRAEGGVKIAGGATAGRLTIATVITVDDECLTSTPLPVPLPIRAGDTPIVRYQVQIKRGLTGKVTCVVSAESEVSGPAVATDLVLKHGSIMPTSSDEGQVLERLTLDFSTGTSSRHEVALGKVKSPFWLSLFAENDASVTLIAPPTSQLKG